MAIIQNNPHYPAPPAAAKFHCPQALADGN